MPSLLIAVDTNFLIDLAKPRDVAHDALEIFRRKVPDATILIPPATLEEVSRLAIQSTDAQLKRHAQEAIRNAALQWNMELLELTDLQTTTARSIAKELLDARILPVAERNDAMILAEAATAGCKLLVSTDSHLRDADRTRLALLLKSLDVTVVTVRKPSEIVADFSPRRRRT
jgi:predicted nucleic acid-binding protein